MTFRPATLLVCWLAALAAPAAPAVPAEAASAKPKYHALVFPDRHNPETFVLVEDFRVNETVSNPKGDRFFMLRTSQGTFELPFESVAEVEFTRFHKLEFLETATYDATVVLPDHGVRKGVIELSNMKGNVGRNPWHQLLMTRHENAERMHRIIFVQRD